MYVTLFLHVCLCYSPWQDSDGLLDFLPGERLKFINITIIDNIVPELEKIFRVELFDANGGE